MKRVTIKTVAQEAGVAVSAASVVLRNHPLTKRYSAETRQRILDAAERLGYRPNFFASQLGSRTPNVLMVWVRYLHDPYTATILEGFEERATERKYRILMSVVRESEDAGDASLLGPQGISAVAMVGGFPERLKSPMVTKMIDEGVNFVQVGRENDDSRILQVLTDSKGGAAAVTAHLVDQGAADFWILAYPSGSKHLDTRLKAFKGGIRRAGCSNLKLLRISRNANTPTLIAEEAYLLIRKQLAESKPPQAVLAMSDTLAYGTMRAMHEKDIRVGRDVAVTGYDDIWTSQFSSPPLTTVNQRMREMGTSAADLLIDTVEGRSDLPEKVLISPELVIRESSRLQWKQ